MDAGATTRGWYATKKWPEWGSRSVWRIPSVPRHDHERPAFPEELAARVIRLLSDPGELVLDPFVGSGTTTAIARALGRRWIGIDADPQAAGKALERTTQTDDTSTSSTRLSRTTKG